MNVLLIEPDYMLGTIYKEALEHAGHTVTWRQNAQSAVHATDTSTPDVIVLELQLPRHSGVEFLYEFRSYPEWQEIPIILHTLVPEQALQDRQKQFEPLGVTQYLYKPMTSLQQLVRAVNEAVPLLA